MIKLGDFNTLTVDHAAEQGLYLQGDEQTGDILLPKRYVPEGLTLGATIEVFVYLDQDERIIATTERPLARVGEFAYLEVAWINKYGAFLKWGLMKDLFCPFREQKQRMEQGRSYIVYVKEDEVTHRLMATAKVEKYLHVPYDETPQSPQAAAQSPQVAAPFPQVAAPSPQVAAPSPQVAAPSPYAASLTQPQPDKDRQEPQDAYQPAKPLLKHGQSVDCLVWQKTDLGFKVIVDNRYQGQVYDNQIFRPLHTGDRMTAYVDHVREDGKIDIVLQATGRQHTLDFAEVLLRYLYENNGRCPLSDKSPAELIYDRFKVSKKVYKKAIGDLYRRRLITITDDEGIRLAGQ